MNDETGSAPSPAPRTWLERLGLALLGGEAKSHEDLIDELRLARSNGVLDGDTLRMLEGALGVVDQVVSDVMVPRGQMVSLFVDTPFDEILKIAIESGHSRFPSRPPQQSDGHLPRTQNHRRTSRIPTGN